MLVDRILALEANHDEGRARKEALAKAAYFEISQVADYWATGNDRDVWPDEMFPCVRPPFEWTWFEYHAPAAVRVNGRTLEGLAAVATAVGHLVHAISSNDKITLHCTEVIESKIGRSAILGDETFLPIDDTGRIITSQVRVRRSSSFSVAMAEQMVKATGYSVEQMRHAAQTLGRSASLDPVLLALTFLNTVNRQVVDRIPSNRLQRARQRRGKLPVVRYSEILVPGHASYQASGPGAKKEPSVSLHVVRGHFKRRATGIYWWHPHMRGAYDKGVTLSRYAVRP